MKTIKQQRLDFLNETIAYYSEDTSRRAIDSLGYCIYYDRNTGNKCAIGRYINYKDYLSNDLDVGHTVDEYYVFALLPEEIKRLGKDFLKQVQILHDDSYSWLDEGLSEIGKK